MNIKHSAICAALIIAVHSSPAGGHTPAPIQSDHTHQEWVAYAGISDPFRQALNIFYAGLEIDVSDTTETSDDVTVRLSGT